MRVCVLGSSSSGNSTFVGSARTGVLIDAGLSARETLRRLAQIGVAPAEVHAICLTHEHSDHTAGVAVLHKNHGYRLFANSGTIEGIAARGAAVPPLPWNVFATGSPFEVGDLTLEPFTVPHDAYDPVGYVIRCGDLRVGVVTDMGMVTGLIRERLRPCQALVIEANHDEQMLKAADRPWHLKQRIVGRQGHLSNEHAAELLGEIAGPGLQAVFLAHLSGECNRPELALHAVTDALKARGLTHVTVRVAPSDGVSEWWSAL